MYVDSHAHLASDELYQDIEGLIARAQAAGVDRIVNICTDKETLVRGLRMAEKYPCLMTTASVTPHDVAKIGESDWEEIAVAARGGRLVAIGETGLDYHYTHSPKEIQIDFLRRYLRLAKECHLPVVIHCRDAFADFFQILDEEYVGGKGVLHCFTGTLDEAKEVVKRGFYLSLSGIVTFKKSVALQEVAAFVPLENLLIETDAPYLAPQSKRGKMNEPA
jgi:TatD DNase family protein